MEINRRRFAVIGYKFGDAGGGNFRVPDLRTKVAVGAGSGFAVGATGGSADAVLAAHQHTATGSLSGATALSNGNHSHGHARPYDVLGQQIPPTGSGTYIPEIRTDQTSVNGSHTHPVTGSVAVTVNSEGESPTNKNYPPYVVMNKIMYAG